MNGTDSGARSNLAKRHGTARKQEKIDGEIYYNSANFCIAVKLSLNGDNYGTVAIIRGEKAAKFTFAVFILPFLPLRFFICPFIFALFTFTLDLTARFNV